MALPWPGVELVNLPAGTALDDDGLFVVVTFLAGVPMVKKFTAAQLAAYMGIGSGVYNVTRYGGSPSASGSVNSTAWQDMIDDAPDGSTFAAPPGAYAMAGRPTISGRTGLTFVLYGVTMALSGVGAEGLRFNGTNNLIRVKGLGVIGSGVLGDDHQGLGTDLATNVGGSNIKLTDCWADACVRGIVFDLTTPGNFQDVWVQRCRATSLVGTLSGQGYGIVLSGVYDGGVQFCYTDQTKRHAIYISVCKNVKASHNTMRRHRDTVATGSQTSGLAIARSSSIAASDNDFVDCRDGAITIEPHETDVNAHSESVHVTGGSIRTAAAGIGDIDIFVGTGNPAASSELRDVSIVGVHLYRTEAANVGSESIRVRAVNGLLIKDCRWRLVNAYTVGKYVIYLAADGGATYSKNIVVGKDNYVNMTLGVGGGGALVEVSSALCSGTSPAWIGGNKTSEGLIREVVFDAAPASEEVVHQPDAKSRTPGTLAAGDTHDYDPFTATILRLTADASGSHLTGLAGGAHGRVARILHLDANTFSLKHQNAGSVATNRILSPTGADVALGQNDVATLEYDALTQRQRIVAVAT